MSMRYDPAPRLTKYGPLKRAAENAAHRAEILTGPRHADVIELFPHASNAPRQSILVYARERGWFVRTPASRAYFQIADNERVIELCLAALEMPGGKWAGIDDEIQSTFELTAISIQQWGDDDIGERLSVWARQGWEMLASAEDAEVWQQFERHFQIGEKLRDPSPSSRWNVCGVIELEEGRERERIEIDLTLKALTAFRTCVPRGERLYALNWDHACFRFDPHADVLGGYRDSWAVPVLPDGDSYHFLAPDFSFGILGDWQGTMCVFGQSLLDAFKRDRPEAFSKLIHVDGRAVWLAFPAKRFSH